MWRESAPSAAKVFGDEDSHLISVPKDLMPNLQPVRAIINGSPKRLRCTRCLRSGKVQRAVQA